MGFFKRNTVKNSVCSEDTLKIWDDLSDYLGIHKDSINGNNLSAITYYSCMQIRCNALAKIPLKLKKYKNGSTVNATDHSLYDIFSLRPNQFTSIHDFLYATEFQRLEYGNAFWVKKTKNGKIQSLHLLDSKQVTVIYDDGHILSDQLDVYYVYNDSKKGNLIYTSDDIVHFKNFTRDGIIGIPIKKYLKEIIDSEKLGRRTIKERFEKGVNDPMIVQFTGDINDARQKAIIKKFEKLGGVKNAGKVVPIPTDFNVSQLQTNLVNNQFFELQGLTTRQIANAFGVKTFQLNDMEKSTYNNITEQNKAFYSDTMQNVYTLYEQEIDYKLFFERERKQGLFTKFNIDVMLRADTESRYNAYTVGISSGFLTIAEAREKEDLKFIKGTDQLIIGNGASIPLDQIGNQYLKGGE